MQHLGCNLARQHIGKICLISVFMAAHSNGQAIIILQLWFLSFFFFLLLFSLPILSGRRLDVYHRPTSTHGVALVRI